MKTKELVEIVSKQTGISKDDVSKVLNNLSQCIIEFVCSNKEVYIEGLGRFVLVKEALKETNFRTLEFWSFDEVEQQIRVKCGETSVIYQGGDDIGVKCKKTQRPCPGTPVS